MYIFSLDSRVGKINQYIYSTDLKRNKEDSSCIRNLFVQTIISSNTI